MKEALILAASVLFATSNAIAAIPANTHAGPTVSQVGSTTAIVSVSDGQLTSIDKNSKLELLRSDVYFEYAISHIICTIRPTCLPGNACPMYVKMNSDCVSKQTQKGQTAMTLTGLRPNTWYKVRYVKDSDIRCVKAPCPTNEYESPYVEFRTLAQDAPKGVRFARTLKLGMRGADVRQVQKFLTAHRLFKSTQNGYYGALTKSAVRAYQLLSSVRLNATGNVDKITWDAMFGKTAE